MDSFRNYNQAAENNRLPILEKLKGLFTEPATILEIGSGSGQHAVAFSANLPHLIWQPSEQAERLDDLNANLRQWGSGNLLPAIDLTIGNQWPDGPFGYTYAANILHIMSAALMPEFFGGIARQLTAPGVCCVYGPFRYEGEFTTESNARFDEWLRQTYPDGGIRDIEGVEATALKAGLRLVEDHDMPANNQLLVFRSDVPGSA